MVVGGLCTASLSCKKAEHTGSVMGLVHNIRDNLVDLGVIFLIVETNIWSGHHMQLITTLLHCYRSIVISSFAHKLSLRPWGFDFEYI